MFLMMMIEKGKQEQMKLGWAVPDNRDVCPEGYGAGIKEQGTSTLAGRGSRAASASMATSRAFSNLP